MGGRHLAWKVVHLHEIGVIIRRVLQRLRRRARPSDAVRLTRCGEGTDILGSVSIRVVGGVISVGSGCLVHGDLVTETGNSSIAIGDNVFIGGGTIIDCVRSIEIEDDVLISYGCIIADSDNHSTSYSVRRNDTAEWKGGRHDWSRTPTKPVRIAKGAWLGARVIVLKGVTIGEGAVVGAGSVVTRDVASYTVAAGNPARLVREIPPDER
jgi:acetyltransferase-like isoleucine patch superfamily enzyme